ncbi:hypothetical protein DFH11DRAFT_1543267 [Phellopilus nigrolimitatus]|nr:hypothetical protein DFH11DRAFT_1543267 [Phellopilus nigrolimitatus]
MSPTQDPPSHPSADQVRVQGIEVDFVTRRPKHRLIIKFESSDGMANATLKFGKKEAVRWEGELFLSTSATLSVSVQELLCFKRTKEFATVSVAGSELGDQHSNQFNGMSSRYI